MWDATCECHLMQMELKCQMGEIKWICSSTLMPRHQEAKDMWTKSPHNVSKNTICRHALRCSYNLQLTEFDEEHAWITRGFLLLFWVAFWYFAIAFDCVCQAKWMSPIPRLFVTDPLPHRPVSVSLLWGCPMSLWQPRWGSVKARHVMSGRIWPGVTGLFSMGRSKCAKTNISQKY